MARYFGTNIISGDLPSFTQTQLDAINSGINSTIIGIYDTHINNSTVHISASDRASWDNAVHKSGNENISDTKTFTGILKANNLQVNGSTTSGSVEGGEIAFNSAPGEVNTGKYMSIDRYDGKFRFAGIDSNNITKVPFSIDIENNTITATTPSASNSTSSTNVATCGWVNDATKSTNVVHRDSAEDITGIKTIKNDFYFKDTHTIGTYSSNTWYDYQIRFFDSAGTRVGRIQPAYINGTNILAMGIWASNGTTEENGITVRSDGVTSAPTPATSDNSTKIATTAFVRNRESDLVHISGTETITGTKTFRGGADTAGIGTSTITIDNISTETGVQHFKDITFATSDNNRIAVIRAIKAADEKRHLQLGIVSTANTWPANIDFYCDADGSNPKLQLPASVYGTNFYGTAQYSNWADLAEQYQSDQKYPVGTLIKFGGEKDITIADNKCNGVISNKPGLVLDSELEDSQPVALVGKTPIRIIGKVNKFDNITLSEIPGVGRIAKEGEIVIAKALENSNLEEEKLVKCVTKFNLN